MNRLGSLTPETAKGAARDLLADLIERHGTVGLMVHSPAVLGGYLQLSRAMTRAKLPREIAERISLAVQEHQDCALCLASHTAAARGLGINDDEIAMARQGSSADPKIAAMVSYGLRVHTAPATITDDQIAELTRYGYSDPRDRRRLSA